MRAVPPPVLDQRDDDQILQQLRKLAARLVPEWKGDWDLKPDAGTMLHRIFTRLMEITLERLNKVPNRNLYAFLNAAGVSLLPPVAARVPLTFSLTSGSAPVLVPKGTRAGTIPKAEQQPVDFETTADLTVVPSTLIAVRTMDPGWDRSNDHTALINGSGSIGFSPFVGTTRLSHGLFLGHQQLLNFSEATVEVSFPGVPGEIPDILKRIRWQCVSKGKARSLAGRLSQSSDGHVKIAFEGVNAIDQTVLKGTTDAPWSRQGLRSRWLQAVLPLPLSEDSEPAKLNLRHVGLSIRGKNVPSDFTFFNGIPLDVTMPFYAFGETPKVGDAFYISCSEALAKPNAKLTLTVEIAPRPQPVGHPPTAVLTWEFLGIDGWKALAPLPPPASDPPPGTVVDGTKSLAVESGAVLLGQTFPVPGKVNGEDGLWIRARITSGDYGKAAEYVPVQADDLSKGYKVAEGTGNLAPPLITNLKLSYEAHGAPQAVVTQNGFLLKDLTDANAQGIFFPFLGVQNLAPPIYAETAPTLYLGFDKAFPEQPITLFFVVAPRAFSEGSGIDKIAPGLDSPPSLRWEYFNGAAWVELSVLDQTDRFNHSGTVDILTPADIAPLAKFDLLEIYWFRAMQVPSRSATNGGKPLRDDPITTPRLTAIFLNTVPAIQAITVDSEIVGSGNSLPGQAFRVVQTPVLARPQLLVLEPELPSAVERDELLQEEGPRAIEQRLNPSTSQTEIWIRWHQVSDFNGSAPHSRHYTLDHGTGEIVFGDGTHGLVVPLGANNIVANYRVGAGSAGNVAKGAVAQVKSAVSGVASVANPLVADGGADLEDAEIVERRGPQALRHRGRAVTPTDFEWLAREATGTRLARVVCLPNVNRDLHHEPGWMTLVIVPQGTEHRPAPSEELIRQVQDSVSSRAFAGLSGIRGRVNVIGPGYIEVAVAAHVVLDDLRQASQVKQRVVSALDKFLHPLTGGPDGDGWVLGRDVFASEVFSVIQAIRGVRYVRSLQLIPSQAQHRLELASPFYSSQILPEGSCVQSSDGRKAALLAESIRPGIEVRFLPLKGFKVGDRVLQLLGEGIFSAPLTINSVALDRETSTQLIGLEPADFEAPAVDTPVATPDRRIRLPVSGGGSGSFIPSSPLRFLTLEDFKPREPIQILPPFQSSEPNLPPLEIRKVAQAPDVHLGSIFLACSGQHRLTLLPP